LLAILLSQSPVAGQTAPAAPLEPPPTTTSPVPASEDIVELSPFVVTAEPDEGYRAANTLAGSRMNAPLILTPAAISVLTKELLDDMGLESTEQYLAFAVNSDAAFIDATSMTTQQQDVNIKIRGFTGAQATRDYFPLGSLSSDIYNVERVDLNRGPNSILYGIGGPGGVINSSSKAAIINGKKKYISVTMGSYHKRRTEADIAIPLIRNRLAVRLNGLLEDSKGYRDFEYRKQKALALALTWRVFKETRFRVNFENNDRDQNIPNNFPVKDFGASNWIAAGRPMVPDPLPPGGVANNPAPGILASNTQNYIMIAPQLRSAPFRLSTTGVDMRPDLPGNQNNSNYWRTVRAENPTGALSAVGVIEDRNFNTIPETANLAGPGNTADQNHWVGTVFLEQRIGNLFIELSFNRRKTSREARSTLGWQNNGVYGEPNPVLPGAYYADGGVTAANPGTLLPDIGAVNPMAGGLYVEGPASYRRLFGEQSNYRASLAYQLDLSSHSRWLGNHSFALVLQRNDGWNKNVPRTQYNASPNNTELIDTGVNQLLYRTYVDFTSPDGLRGAIDPWSMHFQPSPGFDPQFFITQERGYHKEVNEVGMIAMQSNWFGGRLVFTGGYRRDKQDSHDATLGSVKLPNSTNLWLKQADRFDPATREIFTGDTKTLGVVVFPLRWLGVFYNQSDSVQPQSQYDMVRRMLGTRRGKGMDYGIRANLLGGKLYISANRYDTNDENAAFTSSLNNLRPVVNQVLRTLLAEGDPLPKKFADAGMTEWWAAGQDRSDNDGDGYEIEVVGRLTKNWSVSFNYSRSNLKTANIAADTNQLMRDVRGDWEGSNRALNEAPTSFLAQFIRDRDGDPDRNFGLNPATFNDAYEAIMSVMGDVNKQEGQSARLHVDDSINFFTNYRFTAKAPGLLKSMRVGFGGNYRGPVVLGYDDSPNPKAYKRKGTFTASMMIGKTIQFKNRDSLDIQLNISNLFGNEDLLDYAVTSDGTVMRWMYPRVRRSFDLRMRYNF
jgi:outer membrane receptor protein involved in Fe transport